MTSVAGRTLSDMARPAEDLAGDPMLAVIDDGKPEMTVEEWLATLDGLEPTDVDANAAEVLREIREHGER